MRDKWDAEEEAVWNAHRQPCSLILRRLPRQKDLLQKVELETLLATFFGSCGTGLPGLSWGNWKAPLTIENLDGGDTTAKPHAFRGGKWLAWCWAGSNFRLELEVSANHSGGDRELGDLRLFVNEVDVLHLDVSQGLDDRSGSWAVFGVSGFRAGHWMTELNETMV